MFSRAMINDNNRKFNETLVLRRSPQSNDQKMKLLLGCRDRLTRRGEESSETFGSNLTIKENGERAITRGDRKEIRKVEISAD